MNDILVPLLMTTLSIMATHLGPNYITIYREKSPEIRPPLYNGQNFIPQCMVATIEGFHLYWS